MMMPDVAPFKPATDPRPAADSPEKLSQALMGILGRPNRNSPWTEQLAKLKPEERQLLENSTGRLSLASQDGLVDGMTSFRTLLRLAKLDDEGYARILRFRHHYPDKLRPNTLIEFAEDLKALDPDDPRSGIAGLLMEKLDGINAVFTLGDKRIVADMLSQSDPAAWLDRRLDIGNRMKALTGSYRLDASDIFKTDEEKLRHLEALADPAWARLCAELIHGGENAAAFIERVGLWTKLCDTALLGRLLAEREKWGNDKDTPLLNLFRLRGSWIKALSELAGPDELRGLLDDPQAVRSLVRSGQAATIYVPIYPEEEARWSSRDQLPIESDSPEYAAEVRDILETTGLTEILNHCLQTISIMDGNGDQKTTGTYQRLRNTIWLFPRNLEKRSHLPGTLLHETGHAFENLVAQREGGQRIFDRYAARLIYSGILGSSEYAEAYARLHDRENRKFVTESFAEDFRILLQDPTLIPPDRRQTLETLFAMGAPDIGLERLRGKIRKMYGSLYGTGVQDVERPVSCEGITKYAEILEKLGK